MTEASRHPGRSGIRKQNSSPPNLACRSRASLERSTARKSSDRIWSDRMRATRSMMRSPSACPSVSLYHLKLVISTTPTPHQRTRCSTARNDSTRSMNQSKFRSFVLGSRWEFFRQRANGFVLRFFDQLPLIRHDLLDGLKKLEFPRTAQAQAPPDPRSELRRLTWQARVIGRAVG